MSEVVEKKDKIISFFEWKKILVGNRKVVQCHGVFDLLHIGHIKHFESAKAKGDILVVTITPDCYVNKGPGRPYFTEQLRAEAIAALACVDHVIINKWPTAVEAINEIKPGIYVKGVEYKNEKNDLTSKITDEVKAVESLGGTVFYTEDIVFSSSSVLNNFFSPFSDEINSYLSGFKKKYSSEFIFSYLQEAKKLKVLVIGEAIIDIYRFSDVIGKAGKEPTLVAKHKYEEVYAGGILALANHLSNFCSEITCLTCLGEKHEYEDIVNTSLARNVSIDPIYKKSSPTIVKSRYVDEYLRQKLFEVYEINDDYLESEQVEEFLKKLEKLIPENDLVIVIDYGHGFLNEEVIQFLMKHAKFLAVNTQSNAGNNGFNCISKYPKADFVSLASRELQLNYRQKHLSVSEQLKKLIQDQDHEIVMITGGRQGAFVSKKNEAICEVPAFATSVIDRVGAGDAVLAISSLYAYLGAPSELIGFVGNVVGAEAVGIMGNKKFIDKVIFMKHVLHLLK